MCIGAGFAMMEIQIVLATMLRSLSFEPTRSVVVPDPAITIRADGGLWMTPRQRRA